jgi:hypothetical protein
VMDILERVQRPRNQWSVESKCASLTPKQAYLLFWELPKGRPKDNPTREPAYKKFCLSCPVMYECLNFAVVHDEFGVWGGSTRTQREKLPLPLVQTLKKQAVAQGWWEGHTRDLLPVPSGPPPLLPEPQVEDRLDSLVNPLDQPVGNSTQESPLTEFQRDCLATFGFY